jgi:hypothetical protein
MTLEALMAETDRLGIRLEARGELLHVDAPAGVVTPELRDALSCFKPVLLSLLSPVTQFVSLKGGLVLPVPAIALAIDLERRGFRLWLDRNQQFHIEPAPALTDLDRAGIRRWHWHLGAIVAYGHQERSQ